MLVVAKEGSIFKVEICTKKKIHQVYIYGDNFKWSAHERAAKKFKRKDIIDLKH